MNLTTCTYPSKGDYIPVSKVQCQECIFVLPNLGQTWEVRPPCLLSALRQVGLRGELKPHNTDLRIAGEMGRGPALAMSGVESGFFQGQEMVCMGRGEC